MAEMSMGWKRVQVVHGEGNESVKHGSSSRGTRKKMETAVACLHVRKEWKSTQVTWRGNGSKFLLPGDLHAGKKRGKKRMAESEYDGRFTTAESPWPSPNMMDESP